VKKIHFLIAFFALTAFAQQQEMPQEDSKNSSVYLHPISLMAGFASLAVENLYLPLWFNLTGEFSLSGRYALIVNPFIFDWGGSTMEGSGKIFSGGSGIGIRRFVNGNADGLYLQLMPKVGYFKGDDFEKENGEKYSAFSGINADILGYIGYSIKYSKIHLFFDFGLGYGISHYFSADKELFEDDDIRLIGIGTKNGLSIDINIGVGIPLL